MCRISFAFSLHEEHYEVVLQHFRELDLAMGGNGCSIYCISTQKHLRELKLSTLIKKLAYKDLSNGYVFHTRLASIGDLSDKNIHLWNINGNLFCQNGTFQTDYHTIVAKSIPFDPKLRILFRPENCDSLDMFIYLSLTYNDPEIVHSLNTIKDPNIEFAGNMLFYSTKSGNLTLYSKEKSMTKIFLKSNESTIESESTIFSSQSTKCIRSSKYFIRESILNDISEDLFVHHFNSNKS